MDPIHFPRPPKEAFNRNRPISDLIKAQIKHFEHVEQKLPRELRPNVPHHELTTESAAAEYIAKMTAALCGRGTSNVVEMPKRKPARAASRGAVVAIAAAAEPGTDAPRSKRTKTKRKANKTSKQGKQS